MKRLEIMQKFYSSKTLLKVAGGGMLTQHTPHPPPSAPGCIITKNGLKFKRCFKLKIPKAFKVRLL